MSSGGVDAARIGANRLDRPEESVSFGCGVGKISVDVLAKDSSTLAISGVDDLVGVCGE